MTSSASTFVGGPTASAVGGKASAPVRTGLAIKPKKSTFKWGSHRPVLQSLIDAYQPRQALELGMGDSSTPFLRERIQTLVSLENNPEWFAELMSRIPPREGFFPRCRQLFTDDTRATQVYYGALPGQVSRETMRQAGEHYGEILKEFGRFDLALVDQYAAPRTLSLFMLAPHVDIFVVHDTEQCGLPMDHPDFDLYRYNAFFESTEAQEFIHLRIDTMLPWSDVFIRRTLGVDAAKLSASINDGFRAYPASFPDGNTVELKFRDSYLLR